MVFAFICVALFALTVPTTRMAAQVLDPGAVAGFRLLGATIISAVTIVVWDRWVPPKRIWANLLTISFASVAGFTLLITWAMKQVPGSHGAIALAALPAVTAVYGSVRDRSNPGLRFWFFCLLGTLSAFFFFVSNSHGSMNAGDALLAASVFAGALGYVEGGRLSREFGGRRIMSWAILLASPLGIVMSWPYFQSGRMPSFSESWIAWLCIAYVATISQTLGMFLWYRTLAIGPMAKIAMVQLLQPFFTLLASMFFLHEELGLDTWVIAGLVALSVFGANKSRAHLLVAHPRH